MNAMLHERHHRHRMRVRAEIAQHVLPHAERWERERRIASTAWRAIGQLGWLHHHPGWSATHDGPDIFDSVILCEELGRTGYVGVRAAVALHAFMAFPYLAEHGDPALCDRYLGPARAGQRVAGLALTEPKAGSNLGDLELRAESRGATYQLTGVKRYIINSTVADFFVVAARTGDSSRRSGAISLFVVDGRTPGLYRRPLDMLGCHAADTGELEFDHVQVPAENLIGREHHGLIYLMKGLQLERMTVACMAVGGTDACLDHTWARLVERHVGGKALARFDAIRQQLAQLRARNEAARHLAYHAACLLGQGELAAAECSMAKLLATELAVDTVMTCARLCGAAGYVADAPIARMVRDVSVSTIGAGANEVMRDLIAQLTFDEAGWRRAPAGVGAIDEAAPT